MEPVDIVVFDVVHEMVIRVVEAMGENPICPESGSSPSELTGSSGSPMSKPLTSDLSCTIHTINDLYKTEGKEDVGPISLKNSDKQGSEDSKFKTPYKDRANIASKIGKEVWGIKSGSAKTK